MDLDGSRIVVIGGTSGIGRAVAQRASSLGAEVTVASSSAGKVADAQELFAGRVGAMTLDVRDPVAIAEFFEKIGPFDHLVYTAGDWNNMGRGNVRTLDLEAARRVFDVRFWGALAVVQQASSQVRPGGSVTLTDGLIAHRPRAGSAVTSAMAGAVEHLVRGLALDLAPIRVNAVCPGFVATEALAAMPPERIAEMTKRQPVARAGAPDEVAEAYLYLMRGDYTTGQVVIVDGGMGLV